MIKRHLIIGASAAGVATALTLRRLDSACSITILSQEPELPYNKCLLADYAHGQKTQEQIAILTVQAAQSKNIQLCLGVNVVALNRDQKKVTCSDGQQFSYDTLLLGTGASPILPTIDGISTHPNVFTFYRLSDVENILATGKAKNVRTAVVIGAGLSGLECADALNAQGLLVAVIERSTHVLGKQIDAQGAECVEQALSAAGVRLHTNASVAAIDPAGIYLTDGTYIQADLIICAIGVQPNVLLAQKAELKLEDGAVWVDDTMQTSDAAIYAGGDCCMVTHQISGQRMRNCSWPEAMQQGMVAAHNMSGIKKQYAGVCVITSSAFFGIKFATCGMIDAIPSTYVVHQQLCGNSYAKVVVLNDRVYGFVLVGDTRHFSLLRRLILTGESFEMHFPTIFNV